jgi:hypothetical protein
MDKRFEEIKEICEGSGFEVIGATDVFDTKDSFAKNVCVETKNQSIKINYSALHLTIPSPKR